MKFFLQLTFERCFQELLLGVQEYVNKYGDYAPPYGSYISSLYYEYEGDLVYVKSPMTKGDELKNELMVLTLESILQIPIYFDANKGECVDNPEKYVSQELYQKYITEDRNVDPEMHFLIYSSLTDVNAVNNIKKFVSQLPHNLSFFVDIVTLPNEISKTYKLEEFHEDDLRVMADNLSRIVELKNGFNEKEASSTNDKEISFRNLYFLQNVDESGHAKQFTKEKLTWVFGNLLLSLIEGYDYISDRRFPDPITTFGINTFEIDRYSIINNWAINIFKRLCYGVIGADNKELDEEKVNNIFQEITEEERKGLEQINNLPDEQVTNFLSKWKEELKEKILNKIIDAELSNSEKDLLLSYFQSITNRDLIKLEEFDFEKLNLFDGLYIPYINQTSDKENPYSKLKEIILQIQKIKKDMESRQRRINETKDQIDNNYHKDGRWTADGYKIGDDLFKIHKEDGLGERDYSDDLFTDYEPRNTLSLPKNADLKSFFPPIKNQRQQGACSSFSLTSVFEYFLSNELRKYSDMSEAYVYYNGRAESGDTDKDSGANLYDVIKGMADKGVCMEDLCKYDPEVYSQEPSSEAYADGERRKVTSAKRVAVDVDTIKSAINEGYPIVGCFRVFESWQNNTRGFIPMPTDAEREGEKDGFHAMVICGYNDKHGHFIVRNSWGTDFGDKGYCYLPYAYVRDKDLTRYAVAITGINAKEFIKHDPIKDDFDFNNKDKNIQYAILLNLLKEDEQRLSDDRRTVKVLVKDLKVLIEELRSKEDIEFIKDDVNNQIEEIDRQNIELTNNISNTSIWDNKLVHIIHVIIISISVCIIGYGIYANNDMAWRIGVVSSLVGFVSWIIISLLSKLYRKKTILRVVSSNEQRKKDLIDSIEEKNRIRDRIIQILNAIGDIDESSGLNRDLLNLIINTLNDCYNQITQYLNNNFQVENRDQQIILPDWFSHYAAEITIPDFFKKLLINSKGKNIKHILYDIQRSILSRLDERFDKSINDIYANGNSEQWKLFVRNLQNCRVFAQIDEVAFNNESTRLERKQCGFFLSNLVDKPDLNITKTDIQSVNRNRFIFIKIKKVTIGELTLFKPVL